MKLQIALNEHGSRIGESHPRAKFSDRDVEHLFRLVEEGYTSAEIATKLDMSIDTVKKIRCGQRRGQTTAGHKIVHID
jgi:DNA-binding NarL/FixJ family response regulator